MNNNRTFNTITNTISGFVNKFVNMLMPFFVRTVIIYVLGMEYAGLNSLFTSVLQIFNLAELGISSAIVYCMYKPIADGDNELLCALLKYIRRLYHIIGCVILIMGIVCIPFLPLFIKGTVPNGLNLTVMYLIYLGYTVIGYFFYAYKRTLLNASQMVGTISNINSSVTFVQSIIQILVVLIIKNYYIYLVMMPIFAVVNNILISHTVKKFFPEIECKNDLPEDIKRSIAVRVKGLFVTRICTTTRNAFDSIFISAFLGLTTVAIYGNYYYIMTAIIGILSAITTAMTASVGNSLVMEGVEKNYNDLRRFNFIFNWIVGFCTSCLLTMYQPFMRLWMGNDGLFSFNTVIILCIYFYFLNIGSIRAVYHDAAGLWWEARYRAIIEAALNLGLNFVLTQRFGVNGTVVGTLISLVLVNYMYGTQIVFKYYFKNISSREYFGDNAKYGLVTLIGCVSVYNVLVKFENEGVLALVVAFLANLIIFNIIYFIAFRKKYIYKESINLIKHIAQGVLKRF